MSEGTGSPDASSFGLRAGGAPPRVVQPSQRTAYWAMGLGLSPICLTFLVGLPMSIVVLRRCRDGRDHGRTPALVGLVASSVWTVALILTIVLRLLPSGGSSPARLEPTTVAVGRLDIGDCTTWTGTGTPRTVDRVPCGATHASEVISRVSVRSGGTGADTAVRGAVQCGSPSTVLPGRTDLEQAEVVGLPLRGARTGSSRVEVLCLAVLAPAG